MFHFCRLASATAAVAKFRSPSCPTGGRIDKKVRRRERKSANEHVTKKCRRNPVESVEHDATTDRMFASLMGMFKAATA